MTEDAPKPEEPFEETVKRYTDAQQTISDSVVKITNAVTGMAGAQYTGLGVKVMTPLGQKVFSLPEFRRLWDRYAETLIPMTQAPNTLAYAPTIPYVLASHCLTKAYHWKQMYADILQTPDEIKAAEKSIPLLFRAAFDYLDTSQRILPQNHPIRQASLETMAHLTEVGLMGGIPQPEEAYIIRQEAARHHHVPSLHKLALMCRDGKGVEASRLMAYAWMKAAQQCLTEKDEAIATEVHQSVYVWGTELQDRFNRPRSLRPPQTVRTIVVLSADKKTYS